MSDRREYMREYQKERRKRNDVKLLCVEVFGPDEHIILENLKEIAEEENTTIRDLVVMSLRGACAHE